MSTGRTPVTRRRLLLGAIPALLLARGAGAAPSAASLTLLRPQAVRETPAPVAWRVCPGSEESALLAWAAPVPRSGPSPAVAPTTVMAIRFSRPMIGWQMTSQEMPGPNGRDLLLIRLKAPAGARPGRYDGLLAVRRGAVSSQLRVAAEVLPFELMRPSKQYAVSRVPVSAAEWCAPEAADVAPLRRLREIGIGALCLNAAPADRSALESAMRAAGLHGPVLAPIGSPGAHYQSPAKTAADPSRPHQPAPQVPATSSSHHLITSSVVPGPAIRWYAWCAGGPPAAGTMAALKAGGAMVACQLDDPGAASGVDLPVFDASGACGARLLRRDGPLGGGTAGWWQWDAGAATALENRLRCGALLWKSGLSGALVEISPDAPASPDWPLRWEGVRQGVLDSRYLTTLFSLIRQVKDKDRSNPLPGQAEVAVAAALNGVGEHPSPEAADRFRSLVITWILRLGRMV